MLHTIKPEAYLTLESLQQPGNCPDCGTQCQLKDGVVGLLHYRPTNQNGAITRALIWVCSTRCILSFEASQYMGRA